MSAGTVAYFFKTAWQELSDRQDRQGRLRRKLTDVTFKSRIYVHRQIDISACGRIWSFVDAQAYGVKQTRRKGRVIIDEIYFGHPKKTE